MSSVSDHEEHTPSEQAPRNTVLVLRDYCVRLRGADCDRCACACPKDAITFTDEGMPVIDHETCSRCGICFGICDALTSPRITLADVHARMERITGRGDRLHITCEENVFPGLEVDANVVVLPCLAALSPEFWTLLLCEDAPVTIAADLSYCEDCDRAGEIAEMLYSHAIATAEEWSGRTVTYTDVIPEKQTLLDELSDPVGVSRRSMFTNIIGDVGDIATGKRSLRNSDVVQDFLAQREKSRVAAHRMDIPESTLFNDFVAAGRISPLMFPKRHLLLDALVLDPSICERIPIRIVAIDDARCCNTLACSEVCPTKALFPNEESGAITLDPRLCIACEICLPACPHGALSMVDATACILTDPDRKDETDDDT